MGNFSSDEKIIELSQLEFFGSSGSGNQQKFWVGSYLHKLNSKFHEASAEVAASIIGCAFGLDCVKYQAAHYLIDGSMYRGCYCVNYLAEEDESISFATILQQAKLDVPMKTSAIDFYKSTIVLISGFTGLATQCLDEYLRQLLVFDFLICNPDRHFANIELIYNRHTSTFRLAPIFDCGQAFLQRSTMPSRSDLEMLLYKLKMKPFSTNHYKNLIDVQKAKQIATRFIATAGGVNSIRALNVESYYTSLVLRRYNDLMNH